MDGITIKHGAYYDGFCLSGISLSDMKKLLNEAYQWRMKTDGISFASLFQSLDGWKSELERSKNIFFLALDEHDKLCGMARLKIIDNYAEVCNFVVSPASQGKHIGRLLLENLTSYAVETGLNYVMSFTAVNATSSVKCHVHSGFNIIGIGRSAGGYNSYSFIIQIQIPSKCNRRLF